MPRISRPSKSKIEPPMLLPNKPPIAQVRDKPQDFGLKEPVPAPAQLESGFVYEVVDGSSASPSNYERRKELRDLSALAAQTHGAARDAHRL